MVSWGACLKNVKAKTIKSTSWFYQKTDLLCSLLASNFTYSALFNFSFSEVEKILLNGKDIYKTLSIIYDGAFCENS